jgi:hypothetical protein
LCGAPLTWRALARTSRFCSTFLRSRGYASGSTVLRPVSASLGLRQSSPVIAALRLNQSSSSAIATNFNGPRLIKTAPTRCAHRRSRGCSPTLARPRPHLAPDDVGGPASGRKISKTAYLRESLCTAVLRGVCVYCASRSCRAAQTANRKSYLQVVSPQWAVLGSNQ